jgi:hypothetical protein
VTIGWTGEVGFMGIIEAGCSRYKAEINAGGLGSGLFRLSGAHSPGAVEGLFPGKDNIFKKGFPIIKSAFEFDLKPRFLKKFDDRGL